MEGSYLPPWYIYQELIFTGDIVSHTVFLPHLQDGEDVCNTTWVKPQCTISREIPLLIFGCLYSRGEYH